MKNPIKIAVVDDHALFRQGLVALLCQYTNLDVSIVASNGSEFIDMLDDEIIDVVLLDLKMPIMDGINTTDHIQKYYPEIKIIILSMHSEESYISYLLSKGVNGFLLKDQEIGNIIEAIQEVHTNGYYFNNKIPGQIFKRLITTNQDDINARDINFSCRELEVIKLICEEKTNKEISEALNISQRTVDGHRERILVKTNSKNVVGIVRYAMKHNLLKEII